jgi:bacterioferritin
MQGDASIIELLNQVLKAELTAISQYFLDSRMLDDWGYDRLAEKFRDESIDEMKDADALIERILYLDGMPNLQTLDKLHIGENAPEKIGAALELERQAIERLNAGIARAVEVGDNGSRDLLASILSGEEDHADWLESQLSLIDQVGEANYLAQQIRG